MHLPVPTDHAAGDAKRGRALPVTLIPARPDVLDAADKGRVAIALAMVGGYVDAVGYIVLFHLFTAHQSGNSVGLGVNIGEGNWAEVLHRLTPIGSFVVGVAAGALLIELAGRAGVRSTASVALGMEAALLAVAVGVGSVTALGGKVPPSHLGGYFALASLLASSMGFQTCALRRAGAANVRTTFVTGVLTNFAEALVIAAITPGKRREALRAGSFQIRVWGLYLAGGVAGAMTQLVWPIRCLLLPVAAILAIIGLDQRHPLRPTIPENARQAPGQHQ